MKDSTIEDKYKCMILVRILPSWGLWCQQERGVEPEHSSGKSLLLNGLTPCSIKRTLSLSLQKYIQAILILARVNSNALFFRFHLQKEYHVSPFHSPKWLLWKQVWMHDRKGKLAVLCLNKEEKFPWDFQFFVEPIKEQLGRTLNSKSKEEIANSALPVILSQGP